MFHVRLGEFSGNPLLERYLAEVIWRCVLILTIYGRPHDQAQSIAEHEELVDLLDAGDADRAGRLVLQHLGAVEARTLTRTADVTPPDLTTILSRY